MKQIQPVTIWNKGVNAQANYLSVVSIYDNFLNTAKFYYQLFSCVTIDEEQICTQVIEGDLTIVGADYDSWGKNADVNEDAYNIAANKLNLVYVD
jgi:hypothetical protein